MTIASEITRINNNIASAYTACNNKGATMPQTRDSANLATCIGSISAGGGSGDSITREVVNGVYQMPVSSFTFSLPSTATRIGTQAMYYAFYGCNGITSADLSSLTDLSDGGAMQYAFYNCAGLTSVDLSSLTSISGINTIANAFEHCSNLTSVNLNNLTSIYSGTTPMLQTFKNCVKLTSISLSSLATVSVDSALYEAFYGCTELTSVDLSGLTTVDRSSALRSTFSNCPNLTSINLTNLSVISGSHTFQQTFRNCTSLTSLSFPSLNSNSFGSYTDQFNNMLQGVTGCTVHFPSNLQSVIGSWSDVTAGFGGTNTTILYDLPATT